jgi:hypothetical protein
MLYQTPTGTLKDNCVIWHEGRYYLFTMYREEQELADADPSQWRHMWAAVSTDGVHWQDVGPVIQDAPFTLYAMRVWRVGSRFIMNHGSFTEGRQDVLRFWESTDLRQWRYLGPEYDVRRPDGGRLDHMDVIAVPNGDRTDWYGYAAGGLLRSDDGVRWTWHSDFEFSDNLGVRIVLEPGGCERIGGRYYLLAGGFFPDSFGYSVATFIGAAPAGPFHPDYPAFRLNGNGGRHFVALWAGYCRTPQGLLLTNYIVDPSGRWFWHAPLKRAMVDAAGHLRSAYWEGNEALKARPMELTVDAPEVVKAAGPTHSGDGRIALEAAPRQAVWWQIPEAPLRSLVLLPGTLVSPTGWILEVQLQVRPTPGGDLVFPAAGLVLESGPGRGTAILFHTWGQTEIGRLDWDGGDVRFESRDRTGFGCASPAGIPAGKDCLVRILWRRGLFELYLDDLLVQTFPTGSLTGRIGLLVQDGHATFSALRAWAMDLSPDSPSPAPLP